MSKKTLFSIAVLLAAVAGPTAVQAAMVTGNANYSGTVETSGVYPAAGGSSFQAAGNTASSNTPSDLYPAFGVVAFDASDFSSLAGTGVSASATLTAMEYVSLTSSSTGTQAGSVINFYFAQSPTTTATGLGDYDSNNTPGGFDAANFNADLVGSVSYVNTTNNLDTITLTLSPADVAYINNVLTQGSGTFEFFAVATSGTDSARWDGNYPTGTSATLTLNSAAAAPEPASLGLLAIGGAALLTRRRRTA